MAQPRGTLVDCSTSPGQVTGKRAKPRNEGKRNFEAAPSYSQTDESSEGTGADNIREGEKNKEQPRAISAFLYQGSLFGTNKYVTSAIKYTCLIKES